MSAQRIRIEFTAAARESFGKLPSKIREGFRREIDALYSCSDPSSAHKPLTDQLKGFRRITQGRYRALYSVRTERLANGEVLITIVVAIVLFGIRKEGDKKDIYRVAEKLAKLGLLAPRIDKKEPRNNGPGNRR